MNKESSKFLYHLITDHSQYHQPLHEVANFSELSHVAHFQLRAKESSKGELLAIATHIRPYLQQTKFIVNGHLDVALASEADGIHLQARNIPVGVVRKKFPKLIIGYSAHTREELHYAESEGADYVLLGPVYSPISKNVSGSPIGIDKFKEWVSDVSIPVFALGGISESNLQAVAVTGCCGVAGISFFIREGHFTNKRMVF
ncbi:MAG TPA: thiamine phosphate synthase [Acidobacteriota bacterium]|nr:thiamine phosphate synthase [Acidobacteriota bacterium]